MKYDHAGRNRLHWIGDTGRALLAGCAVTIGAACGGADGNAGDAATGCNADGSLSVTMYGGIRGDLDWRGASLECSGMPRPDDRGARLHFVGSIDRDGEAQPLAFIIGLPDLTRGNTVRETPASVTLSEEDGGRFFSSAEAEVCWSDVTEHARLAGDEYRIRGIVYCVSPLAELNGGGGVTFTDLRYTGRVDWGTEK